MYKRCLILGGKGFVGSHLVEALLSSGFSVRVFDRADAETLIAPERCSKVEFIEGDFADPISVAVALKGCDICFHLISTSIPKTSNESPAYDLQSNVLSTINLLEQVRGTGLKKIVFLSSGGTVYGIPKYLPIDELHPTDPLCSYGISKLTIEKYLDLYRLLYGIDYVVLRISNLYGERQRLIAAQGAAAVFLGKALKGEKVTIWGDGSVARDYIYIADVIDSLIAVMNYFGKERIFNVGSGVARTLLELIEVIESVAGRKVDLEFKPSRTFDVPVNSLDIRRAMGELGWAPKVGMQEGLTRMKSWVEAHGKLRS
ncbi:MAG: NAD-dependent epimerase/dehydratase family protein [Candidatus Manganitrophus sp.]|nr:NAD-dependent epimerase/dehydratase family protein [Candidatus Manganitrophus sp.]MDC4223270.1 NAD-dependent epimerase/dehydratase family protein [Candidatus Manganitrophus sp.]WDT71627.1 MAG: NAD-dependent epimerase/dehydratase family protein [Candidatus Manganitrophus sp.]WDT76122.1 MAG: NAD-dependent epimerase/dehydratase family protein [Candidatus Manganitrophus sp.]WDT81024.1 MAG: NAD-dependent epimerase/dehydratase family protein [Candidatus Manganitrophus sp.]